MKKSVVITGVSTGIGNGATREFVKQGYHVFGSVRKKEDAVLLKKEFGEDFTPLIFDITDREAISNSARLVEEKLAGQGLAGLINNAGSTEGAPLMHISIDDFKKHLDILVTGQLAVTQAFLPLVGAVKNCSFPPGKIMNITSINGKIPSPFLGAYVTAKHAMEGLSKVLRIELQLYGIDVIVVGPGIIHTPIWDKAEKQTFEQYKQTDYYQPYQSFSTLMRQMLASQAMDTEKFSKKLFRIFQLRHPKPRYAVLKNKLLNWTILLLIPTRIINRIYAQKIDLKKR